MVCGTGGWKRVQQTGLTLFYPCLPGDVGLAEVERGLLGTESPLDSLRALTQGHFLAISLSQELINTAIPRENPAAFNPIPGC